MKKMMIRIEQIWDRQESLGGRISQYMHGEGGPGHEKGGRTLAGAKLDEITKG